MKQCWIPLVVLLVCSSVLLPGTADAQTASFVTTGSMTQDRYAHTATLLSDGKVLITGGIANNGSSSHAVASAEVYDPSAGTFTATGAMTTARYSHTATLLSDGKVLIAGGELLDSAELYDPATGTFIPTGSMGTARYKHTATLLNDGKVLITGGFSVAASNHPISSAEVYDPAAGTFSATGSMTSAREGHTATLLNSGKVLIAGGESDSSSNPVTLVASSELFDPTLGTFAATGSMSTSRIAHTATLLNSGKVLITSGTTIVPSGFTFSFVTLNSAELYDPTSGTFAATGNMTTARVFDSATLLNDGKVLIAGGQDNAPNFLSSAELYDPATAAFNTIAGMTAIRANHTATLLSNLDVLIAGGLAPVAAQIKTVASAELYDMPGVTVSPVTVSFGNQTTATSSAPQSVTLKNSQLTNLTITGISIAGPDSGDFAESENCGSTLNSGASCAIDVTFTPTAAGSRAASLTITDDASGSPRSVDLTGTGTTPSPAVSLNPLTLAFGVQPLSSTSPSQSITLTNTGDASLALTGISITGTDSGDFAQSNTCGNSVMAGASCTIGVNFTPSVAGTRGASLRIADNASGNPHSISLTGTGVQAIVALSASSLDFGNGVLGTLTPAQTLTLTNSGTLAATLAASTPVTIIGTNAADFAIAGGTTCVANLVLVANGGACIINLSFAPGATGSRTATLQVGHNGHDSPLTASLAGSGSSPFSIQPNGVSSSSITVKAGQTAQFSLELLPAPGFSGTVSLACSGAPTGSTCNVPSSLALNGGTTQFSVAVTTTAAASGLPINWPDKNLPPAFMPLLVAALAFGLMTLRSVKQLVAPRAALAMVLVAVLLISGCAAGPGALTSPTSPGGNPTPTPSGRYTLTVTATSGGATQAIALSLQVQ